MNEMFTDFPPAKRQMEDQQPETEIVPLKRGKPDQVETDVNLFKQSNQSFSIDSIESEQNYIVNKFWNKLQKKNISIEIPNKNSYSERRLANYFDRFIKFCNSGKCNTNEEKVRSVNELLYNIYTVIYTKTPIMSSGIQISSYINDTHMDYIDSCMETISISQIRETKKDHISKENVLSALFWITLNFDKIRIDPKLFFLGTRIDNSRQSKSDKYIPYSNDNTPFMYYLRTLISRVEQIINSDEFKSKNDTVILTNKTVIETAKYFEKTKNIKVNLNISGCRDTDFFKFDVDPDTDELRMEMISKPFNIKIENHELISFSNSSQLKMFFHEENGVDANIIVWNKFGFII